MNNLNNNFFLNINMDLDNLNRQELRLLLNNTLSLAERRNYGVNGNSTNERIREFLRNYRPPPPEQGVRYNDLRRQARLLGYDERNGRTTRQLQEFIRQQRINPILQQITIQQPLRPTIQQVNPVVNFERNLTGFLNRRLRLGNEAISFREGNAFRATVENRLGLFNREGRFKLRIISYLNPNIYFEKIFYGYQMFLNWYLQLINADEREQNSAGSLIDYDNIGQDVYKFVIPEVTALGRLLGGCDSEYCQRTFENPKYKFNCVSYESYNNTCGLVCINNKLGLDYSMEYYYKTYGLIFNDKISVEKIEEIYTNESRKINMNWKKPLIVIDKNYRGKYDYCSFEYIMIDNNHYYDILSAKEKEENKKLERGLLFWDIETRPDYNNFRIIKSVKDKKSVDIKTYCLVDTITHIWYKGVREKSYKKLSFETDIGGKTSIRKFIDWINDEMNNTKPRYYRCYAHNSSRFDNFFLLAGMTRTETLCCEIVYRGISLVSLNFNETLFKDTCCFLTASLKSLCKSFKIKNKKQTEFEYNGEKMTNEQLCFYKPELSINEFMELKEKEPKFWELYNEYCLYDCISLQEIWEKFTISFDKICDDINPYIKRYCSLSARSVSTIGGLAKKMINTLNQRNCHYEKHIKFYEFDDKEFSFMRENLGVNSKYEFIRKFVRGGISHGNQLGIHKKPIVSYDITSEYPSAMNYMRIPTNNSSFVKYYATHFKGFYHLVNLQFKKDCKKFKPIAEKDDDDILNWNTGDYIKEAYLDTYMIEYLKKEFGLISFEVVIGLVSNQDVSASKLFGKYVMGLFNGKALQDELKEMNNPDYNPALREAIKLFLNSVTGKLVERTENYKNKIYTTNEAKKKYYDVGIEENDGGTENYWLICGIIVYSWSKTLLFDYINCLPNGSDDAINVETDSIYFHKENEEKFIENLKKKENNIIRIGSNLGNIKKESEVNSTSYFIRKKVYKCGDDYKNMKCKGIPSTTIDDYGNTKKLFDEDMFIKLANGEKVKFEFKTLKKNLYGKTEITTHTSIKEVTPLDKDTYKIYE